MKKLIIVLIVLLSNIKLSAQTQHSGLGGFADFEMFNLLTQSQWKDNLTESDFQLIRDGLKSSKYSLRKEALKSICINRLSSFIVDLEFIEKEENLKVYKEIEGKILLLLKNPDSFESTLNRLIGKESNFETNLFLEVAVISYCKKMRNSKQSKINLPERSLSDLHKLLISYSNLDSRKSVIDIISKFELDQGQGIVDHFLSVCLQTYGEISAREIYIVFLEESRLSKINKKGREYLIKNLTYNHNRLLDKEKEGLIAIINNDEQTSRYFNGPEFKYLFTILEGKLKSKEFEEISKDLKKLGDKDLEKEYLEKITRERKRRKGDKVNQPAEVKKNRKRYFKKEQLGEDYSEYTKEELINKLRSSKDNVELMKAAQVLGDRDIEGTLSLNTTDKQVVQRIVLNCLDRYMSRDLEEREEAAQQIRRLWRLAAPTLIRNLENKNLKKVQLAMVTLLEMKDEAIIKTIIKNANENKDIEYKKFYIQILSSMNQTHKIYLPNRESISKQEADRLYKNIIEPAIEKLERDIKRD